MRSPKYKYPLVPDRRRFKEVFYEIANERGLQPQTIRKYWSWIKRLILFSSQPLHPAEMSDDFVIDFIQAMGSRACRLQAINAFQFNPLIPAGSDGIMECLDE